MALESSARLQQLRDQMAELQAQIEEQETAGKADALEQIKSLMETYGITVEDITKRKRGPNKKKAPEQKYQDPESGLTWSGRGREPSWIKGKKREKFLMAA